MWRGKGKVEGGGGGGHLASTQAFQRALLVKSAALKLQEAVVCELVPVAPAAGEGGALRMSGATGCTDEERGPELHDQRSDVGLPEQGRTWR